MRTINLPDWNDLPEDVRVALADEGRFWVPHYGGDFALAIYNKLREKLDGLNLDVPDLDQRRIIWPEE